jgi:hypothetical protein
MNIVQSSIVFLLVIGCITLLYATKTSQDQVCMLQQDSCCNGIWEENSFLIWEDEGGGGKEGKDSR